MKKQSIFLGISVLLGVFASCSQDYESEELQSNREVVFNTVVSQTRTVTDGKIATFVPDDQIGIFGIKRGGTKMYNQNVPYTYTSENEWTAKPAITFPITGDAVDFYAYYPYGSYESTTFEFTVLADQSADNGYALSDLLLSKNTTSQTSDKSIELQFTHAMAMVEVKPVLSEGSDIEIQTVKLTAVRAATVDLAKQTAAVKTNVQAEEVTLLKVADGVYRAVVPVQTLKGRVLEFVGIDKATNLSALYDYSLTTDKKLVVNSITTFTINL